VKCNCGSDFAGILTMNVPPLDKTGKVDQMAEASGEMGTDQIGIPASSGKKCLSDNSVLNDATYDVVIKLSLLLFEMCINKVYLCYLTLCMLNPNLFVITHTRRLIECRCSRCNGIPVLAKYLINTNVSGRTYNRCILAISHNHHVIYKLSSGIGSNTPMIMCVTYVPICKGRGPTGSTYTNGSIRSNWQNSYRE
jgi:hypothetical protein